MSTIDKSIHPSYDVLNTFTALFHYMVQFSQISGSFRRIQFIAILLGPWLFSVAYGICMLRVSKSVLIQNSFAFQYFKLCPDEQWSHDIINH